MSLIRMKNVSVRYDDRQVLKEVYFRVGEKDRVGLIGKSGSGKTTLLKMMLGREEPTEGEIELARGVRIGYFSQFSELDGQLSVQQVLEEAMADVRAIEQELKDVEQAMGSETDPEELQELVDRQARLLEEMEHRDGWNYSNQIDTVLSRLGFSEDYRHRPISQLSGGWRNRAALARIVIEEPDVLLLDEPTNYLDIEGIAWLESWIEKFKGGLVLVSHDRDFLDRVANRIVEIENYHLQEYAGGFKDYVRARPFRLKTLENQFQYEQELLAYESEAIADRAEVARDPSGALKRKLANIKKSVEPKPVDRIVTAIYQGLRVPNQLCTIEGLSKSYGNVKLFSNVSLSITRGERWAILGRNGCGKSTLLKAISGEIEPDAGRISWQGDSACVSFNRTLEHLDLNDTPTHAVNVVPLAYLAPRKQVNQFLELMQFSEYHLRQKIGTLSGGQKARVALAMCLLSGAQVLLLDEPTNHLDVTSAQVMERALMHFPGAVIAASHDRFFIDKIATRLLVFEGESRVREVLGNWSMWNAHEPNRPAEAPAITARQGRK